jgi:uncharacterized membrane protein YdjX (TVP38/TMEM64 family)
MVADVGPTRLSQWRAWAMRPVAPRQWDFLLRASGLVGILGIVLTAFVPIVPVRDLAVFFSLTLFINGPYSPLTPFGYEPILMTFGQIYPPLLVAAVGVLGQLMVESVNYHLYDAAMRSEMMAKARGSFVIRKTIEWFDVQPFLTTFVCALTPIPFWIARTAAPLADYPMRRYLTAMALGRLPRLWFYAAIGAVLPFSGDLILGVGLGATVVVAVLIAWHQYAAARAAAAA